MGFYFFVGKVLFVSFFVISGIAFLHDTEVVEKRLFVRYERLYEWCSSIGRPLPVQMSPSAIKPNFPVTL